MKISYLQTDGLAQILMTPENDFEESACKAMVYHKDFMAVPFNGFRIDDKGFVASARPGSYEYTNLQTQGVALLFKKPEATE